MRLSWTLDEFYADGGPTAFADRVGAVLGIPAWRIKTVAVYKGSVVVDFMILADKAKKDPKAELKAKGKLLTTKLADRSTPWLGAPIISVTAGGITINEE